MRSFTAAHIGGARIGGARTRDPAPRVFGNDRAWHAGPNYRDIAMLFNQARTRLAFGGCMYVLFSTDSDLAVC